MSSQFTGLDRLQRELEEAQRALRSLDGAITTLKFDPKNPASVQEAIRQMETAVDRKVSPYGRNVLVSKIAQAAKDHFRSEILKRASGGR